jgi:hypothetical protein
MSLNKPKLSLYYTAQIKRERAWLLSSVMRGTEHVAFDRCINKQEAIFEFFVPKDTESIFLEAMDYLKKEGVLLSLKKEENRLLSESKL